MKKVFVSGCYDIIHGGHIEFFTQAKQLGDYLIVCFAGDESLLLHKGRKTSLPQEHKVRLLESIAMVDEVVIGDYLQETGLDFKQHFLRIKPDFLVVTEDDKYGEQKMELCAQVGAKYIVLPKTLNYKKTSTTEILTFIKAPTQVPLRVDFAGGWLDVPQYAQEGGHIVNLSVSPLVSLKEWPYEIGGGLGGSAAYALLTGRDGVASELALGVGWQDPAVIKETGLCVWKSGEKPSLAFKTSGKFLQGKMAIIWTGKTRKTYENTHIQRNWELIFKAGNLAMDAVYPLKENYEQLIEAVKMSYTVQIGEGMEKLETHNALAYKYCGGGWGGYALYLFKDEEHRKPFLELAHAHAIEPYISI